MKPIAAHTSFTCPINISIDQTGHKVTQSAYGCCEALHTHAPFVNLSITATRGVTPERSGCRWWLGHQDCGRFGEGYRLEQLKGWLDTVVLE
jgi:hypothetical protein